MPEPLALEPNETIVSSFDYQLTEKSEPFAMVLTDQALHLLRQKRFAVSDPWYFERVPLGQVREVHIQRLRPLGWTILAVILVIAGGFTTWAMMDNIARGISTRVSGWPVAVLIGGLILPFVARGRFGLAIVAAGVKPFRWKPPFVIGSVARKKIDDLLSQVVSGARKAGILVRDERSPG